MRDFVQLGLAAAALLFGVGPLVAADEHKIVAREGAVELILLRQTSVQHELKLTPEEIQKIDEFAQKQWKKAMDVLKMPENQQTAKFDELTHENHTFLTTTLKPEQHKRLNQIAMHVAGLLFVMDPRYSKELNLTPQQKMKIEELQKNAHKEAELAIVAPDKAARGQKMEELRKQHRQELMSVLNDEQKTKWKELAGPPFTGKLEFEDLGKGK